MGYLGANLYPFLIHFGLMLVHGSLLRSLWIHFGTPFKIIKNFEKVLFYGGGSYISKKMYPFYACFKHTHFLIVKKHIRIMLIKTELLINT